MQHNMVCHLGGSINVENKYRRNLVRNEIIPALETQIPGSKHRLLNSIEHLQSANVIDEPLA